MRTMLAMAAAMAVLGSTSQPASAQERWAVEVRGGIAVPTQEIGNDDLSMGAGFEGTLQLRVQEHLALYAGWDWIRFNAETSFAGSDVDFEETGYSFGLRFEHPLGGESGPVAGWVRLGGIYDHLELEDAGGTIIADSGHGLGFEVGAGVALSGGGPWSFVPGVRYRSLSRPVDTGAAALDVDLTYLALDVGLAWWF